MKETCGIRGLEITRRLAETRRIRGADIPILRARSLIRAFRIEVSLMATPLRVDSRAGQVAVHARRVQAEPRGNVLLYLCRPVLDVSDSLDALLPARKTDTGSKYEYHTCYLTFSRR